MQRTLISLFLILGFAVAAFSQDAPTPTPTPASAADIAKAEAIIARAVTLLGGEKYLNVKTQIGRGQYSTIRDEQLAAYQTFVDVTVFPDKERTEFKLRGARTVQTNSGDTGWVYDAEQEIVKVQNEGQIANFRRSLATSLDNLLRGSWKRKGHVAFVGRRPSTLGKRNDVIRLTYDDGTSVEFEFSDDGLPQKAIHKETVSGEETTEEDRYAQFVDFGGIKAPLIIDRFTNGKHSSRINYESIEFNKPVDNSIFTMPATAKEAKKDLRI